jgi:hypothetical protein
MLYFFMNGNFFFLKKIICLQNYFSYKIYEKINIFFMILEKNKIFISIF